VFYDKNFHFVLWFRNACLEVSRFEDVFIAIANFSQLLFEMSVIE